MFARRHWIPPGGLLFAQTCHGLSWILLLWIAINAGVDTLSAPTLAWIHLVALGWFTVAALSILLHVIPTFTGLQWRLEQVARASLVAFALATGVFVLSLLVLNARFASIAAAAIFIGLLYYVLVAWWTLSAARGLERTERAIARAILVTLLMLVAVASLGLLLSFFISGTLTIGWIARLPAAHANLGFYGWLSLLVYGVSARTVRPICGTKSRFVWIHIIVGTSTLVGAPTLAVGLGLNSPVMWIGAGLLGFGAMAYIADMGDILIRATESHRPPQAFMAAAIVWLFLAVALGAATIAGRQLSFAYGFVILIGWIGQMVNAHTFHIGTRLIATVYRGDDDETRPEHLLDRRLTWASFGLFQTAVASIVCGLALNSAVLVDCGAAAGIAAWLAMLLNLIIARARARRPAASDTSARVVLG